MNEKLKYKLVTFIRYLGDSFFYPFFANYLYSKDGIEESKVGILLAITPLIGLIMNPVFSSFCKNFNILKKTLGIIGILEALMIVLIVNSNNFYVLFILTILMSICGCSHYGLCDSLITIFATENKINFSIIRVFGSISYILGTSLGGILIKNLGNYSISFYLCAFYFIVASILYFSLKSVYNNVKKEEKRNYKELFKNKGFIYFLIFYMLMYGVLKTSNNFYGLLLENRGLNIDAFGYNYIVFVGVEVGVLFILNAINKRANYKILMFVAIMSISIMMLVNSSTLPPWVIIAFSGLRGISWGIILHVNNKVVVNLLGVKNATAGTMALDLAYSIIVIINNFVGGYIIEQFGYQTFYFILAVIGFADAIFYLAVVRDHICVNDVIDDFKPIEVKNETVHSN